MSSQALDISGRGLGGASARPPVAQLVDVSKHYGSVRALDGLSLDVHRGEVLALLGPNGAGKTTAISLLLGLLRPDGGAATVFGLDPRSIEVRTRLGAMLQVSGLAPTLTVRETLQLYRSYYPRPASLRFLVELADLGELLDRRTDALSGGQLQRLMLGLAMAGDPELVFLDEPSAGMDLESRRRLWQSVRDVASAGRSVLLTTHHLEEADALADRVAVIHRGTLIAEGTPTEIEASVSGRRISCVTSIDLARLRAIGGVNRVERRGAATEIFTARAEDVLRQLFDLDPGLSALEVGGAGLEQAFLALTRDDQDQERAA
ncbi:MAG: ABC transporter ATP-binding protein [Acidobacteriota bacterium]